MMADTVRHVHALITGATGGLGQAIAARLLQDGVSVTLLARDEMRLQRLSSELRATASGTISTLVCDLADGEALAATAQTLFESDGPPNVLVNNAAIQGPIGRLDSLDWDDWSRTLSVDLMAPARLCHALVPSMVQRGWGRIVNISGGGAAASRPHFSAYAAAKSGLVRLTETLAAELKGTGVTANAVAPGAMNTRMLDEILQAGPDRSQEYRAAVERQQSGGQSPEAAANLVSWLVSAASDGITGRLISAVWDPWETLETRRDELAATDIYTLRRIVPKDRGKDWGER